VRHGPDAAQEVPPLQRTSIAPDPGIAVVDRRLRTGVCVPGTAPGSIVTDPDAGARLGNVLLMAAVVVAVVHGLLVVFMVTGSLLALRRPRLLWAHVPVALAILVLYATNSDCPLTTLELWLRELAGEPGYRGGFLGHYVTEPMGFPIRATSTQVGIYVTALVPNVVGYGLLAALFLRGRSATVPEEKVVSRRTG
jgi:hypothetical protein